MVVWAVVIAIVAAVIVGAVEVGLVRTRSGEEVDDPVLFSAIMTVAFGSLLHWFMAERKRPDRGFRHTGLIPLALLAALIGALLLVVSSVVWPWLGSFGSGADSFVAGTGRSGLALFYTGGVFLTAALLSFPSFCLLCVVPFPRLGAGAGLLMFLVISGSYAAVAIAIGMSPVSTGGIIVLVGGLATGLVVATLGLYGVEWYRRNVAGTARGDADPRCVRAAAVSRAMRLGRGGRGRGRLRPGARAGARARTSPSAIRRR